MTAAELKKAVKFAYLALKSELIVLGASSNIFSTLDMGINSVKGIATECGYRNKEILKKYLNTLVRYHVLEGRDSKYILTGQFLTKINKEELEISKTTEDFLTYASVLMRFFNHYLIDKNHPHVTTSFINDPDIWNLWLESEWFKLSRKVIVNECKLNKDEALLDVGCGSCSPAFYGKIVGPRGRVLGIDKSMGIIDIAQKRIKKTGYGWVAAKRCDIEQDLIFKEKYDIAVFSDMLQYVNDLKKVLSNTDKALKNGGRMVIFTICFADSNEEYIPLMEFINAHVKDYVKNVSRSELENELRRMGYEIQKVSEESMLLIAQKG
jgi:ubiquinone/menaquinone biosynthesis C-methylase UbiE